MVEHQPTLAELEKQVTDVIKAAAVEKTTKERLLIDADVALKAAMASGDAEATIKAVQTRNGVASALVLVDSSITKAQARVEDYHEQGKSEKAITWVQTHWQPMKLSPDQLTAAIAAGIQHLSLTYSLDAEGKLILMACGGGRRARKVTRPAKTGNGGNFAGRGCVVDGKPYASYRAAMFALHAADHPQYQMSAQAITGFLKGKGHTVADA